MWIYSVILFVAAALFFVIGVLIFRGNTNLIHEYHRRNLAESIKRAYGRSFAKALFLIALTFVISGVVALFSATKAFAVVSVAILLLGLFLSIVMIVRTQNKYNGGIF